MSRLTERSGAEDARVEAQGEWRCRRVRERERVGNECCVSMISFEGKNKFESESKG